MPVGSTYQLFLNAEFLLDPCVLIEQDFQKIRCHIYYRQKSVPFIRPRRSKRNNLIIFSPRLSVWYFVKRSQFWRLFFSFLFVLKNRSLLCLTIDLIWLKTFRSLLFYFMIIIISVLEMVDLYRKDRSNSASRKVDLGLGETN